MTAARPAVQLDARADSVRWWLLLGLFAAIAMLLALSHSVPLRADHSDVHYVTSAFDTASDCGETKGSAGGHCHATIACSGYAQVAASPPGFDGAAPGHALPTAQGLHISRTPAPNPQPPKNSSQA